MKWMCVIIFIVITISYSYCETGERFNEKGNSFRSILEPVNHLAAEIFASYGHYKDDYCDDVYTYPIDLPADATLAAYGNLKFTGFQFAYKTKLIIIDGISEYHFKHKKQILVSEGGLKGVYYLHKIRYFTSSRHTVAGARYIGEGQFICINIKYDDYKSASEHPDGLAIFVVFLMIGTEENVAYSQYLEALKHVEGDPPSYELPIKISPSAGLPDNRCSFFRYRGRYSRRHCKEIATWTIFTDPIEITEKQYMETTDQLLLFQKKLRTDFTDYNDEDDTSLRVIDIDRFKLKKRLVTLQPRIFCKNPSLYKEGFPWFLFHKHY